MRKLYGHYEEGAYTDSYGLHVNAMTAEDLHGKFEIDAELAYRDQRIAELEQQVERLERGIRWACG